jgi:hypothetical protein
VLLLVGTCLQLCEAGGVEEGTLLRQTLAGLKQRVRTRPARVPLPLLAEPNSVRLNFCMVVELSDTSGQYERSIQLPWPSH